MKFIKCIVYWTSPNSILSFLNEIDKTSSEERKCIKRAELRKQFWIVTFTAAIGLLSLNYLKYASSFNYFIELLKSMFSLQFNLKHSYYIDLYSYIWWGIWHVISFIILPMLAIKLVLKQNLSSYGWQLGSVCKHWPGYLILTVPIVLLAILASFREDFIEHYPFYRLADRSWLDLIAWEVIYIAQFIAVEFFFRGFLLNGLRVQLGSLAIPAMCLPYLMFHFPKIWLESAGSILFGFFLGVLSLKSRSIWGGVIVHVVIALSLDFSALIQWS